VLRPADSIFVLSLLCCSPEVNREASEKYPPDSSGVKPISRYEYDPTHLYTGGTDPLGNPLPSAAYDSFGRLQATTQAATDAVNPSATYTTTYSYTLGTNTTTITYPPDASGHVGTATLAYDIVGSRGYVRQHSQTLNEEGQRISRRFRCLRMRKTYLKRMSTESAQANINYGNSRPLLIAHPVSDDERRAVAAPIVACEDLILSKERKIAALQRVKKSLMQSLLTGRLRLLMNDRKEAMA